MPGKRVLQVTIGIAIVLITLVALQPLAKANNVYIQSKGQAALEYQLGERYGASPQDLAQSAGREYQLGERYGVLPATIAREYVLGERYGVTPAMADREYWLGERYGVTP